MAVERFALGAKQAHAMVRHFIHDAFEPGRELRAVGHGLVVGDAVAIEASGTERTSATAVTPASLSKATKRSAARLEWPMVKSSQVADRVIGLIEFARLVRA